MLTSIPIYKSKYTLNVESKDVHFQIGEVVKYRMRNGKKFDITINSERKYVEENHIILYGYEAIFSDDNKKYFAAEKGIIGWEGKC